MKNILCYGDSNTWGFVPGECVRYPADVRWTGVCQRELGEGYHIIEDGINGRTTVYTDPWVPNTKGADSIGFSAIAASPLDLVVLSLGTNDLKFVTAENSARGVARLIDMLLNADAVFGAYAKIYTDKPRILLVSPIRLHDDVVALNEGGNLTNVAESHLFAKYFKKVAEDKGVEFIDASLFAEPSPVDGVHMMPDSHEALGKAIAAKIKEILG